MGDSSAGDAKEHVRDAVQYRNPSSCSARPMTVGWDCSPRLFLTTERIHKHEMYKVHVVNDLAVRTTPQISMSANYP